MTRPLSLIVLFSSLFVCLSACQDNVSPNLEESLDLFAGLEVIPEAQQTNVTIDKGSDDSADGYFSIQINNVDQTPLLSPGVREAWCLEWHKSLRSDGDIHQDVKWFSTGTNDNWKPLNYLFSIRRELQTDDPDLTFKDFQAVVWVLAGEMDIAPEFDVLNLPVDRIPSRLRNGNDLAIDREKVVRIARRVMAEAPEATGLPAGIVAQTASDQQDIFTPVSDFIIQIAGPSSASGFYETSRADFGPQLTSTGITGDLVLAEGDALACDALENFPAGSIALVNRGDCRFQTKVFNAQQAGAIGVVVTNTFPEDSPFGGLIVMSPDPTSTNSISIPSLFINLEDGNHIKDGLPATVTLRRRL